jgi:peptidoglycan/xylan/chitin deacetylase (PgdA/CDA1 family)
MKQQSRYPRQWEWPNGARIAISINMGFEAFMRASQVTLEKTSNKIDHFSLSYAEYGAKTGAWRLLDLLDEFGFKGSVSTNGLAAERYSQVVRAVSDAGHEINGHAWANDVIMKDDDPEGELAEIRRCTKALTEAAGVRPVGWTSPGSAGSANTLSFLKGEGYLWNGDDASDDLPFLKTPATARWSSCRAPTSSITTMRCG